MRRAQARAQVVLASGSPRRLELLKTIGIEPVVSAADVDETPAVGETADELVERLAVAKATKIASTLTTLDSSLPSPPILVVGADTVVVNDGLILGKPASDEEAAQTLTSLSGRRHSVASGVAVIGVDGSGPQNVESMVVTTFVNFKVLSSEEIEWYVATGEHRGKAGSYAIQGRGALLVNHIEGSYQNVVGLPLSDLDRLTGRFGWPLRSLAAATVSDAS